MMKTRNRFGRCVVCPAHMAVLGALLLGIGRAIAADAALYAVGDLCSAKTGYRCEKVADILRGEVARNPGAQFLALGDLAYERGSNTDFAQYHRRFGAFKSITRPTSGNHEWKTAGAGGYHAYFPGVPDYYAFDVGDKWRIYSLSTDKVDHGVGSAQVAWLKRDLAATLRPCIGAFFHRARWSRGHNRVHDDYEDAAAIYDTLYDSGRAEFVLSGHRHDYQRHPRRDKAGNVSPAGIRQFVVGTGGDNFQARPRRGKMPEVQFEALGLLKLVLSDTGYAWQFLPASGGAPFDQGADACSAAVKAEPAQ